MEVRPTANTDLANSVKSILCLWAALTCPDEESWHGLMEDVVLASLQGKGCSPCPDTVEGHIWKVIITHMVENIPEA